MINWRCCPLIVASVAGGHPTPRLRRQRAGAMLRVDRGWGIHMGRTVLGAVVDAVADVVALPANAIKAAPQFQGQVDASFVRGIATLGERMLIVVDIESLLSSSEMGMLKSVAATDA